MTCAFSAQYGFYSFTQGCDNAYVRLRINIATKKHKNAQKLRFRFSQVSTSGYPGNCNTGI